MYNPQEVEKKILKFWKDNETFEKLRQKVKGKPTYSFIDGPITANNPMGVHHAWGRTLKDIYPRIKAKQGFDQRFQPGFDCQGLWVEVEVEKDLGFNSKKDIETFGLDNFSKACRKRVEKYSKVQIEQSIRLGQWMDWKDPYFTMSDNNIEHIWFFLKKCQKNNWLYKSTQVMPWCKRCGTSLSQHEMADSYKELTHKAVYVKYPLKENPKESLLIWTTTTWTLPANIAIAVNPELDYVKAKSKNNIIYVSKKLAEDHKFEILENLKGKDLIGKEYLGPYDEKFQALKEVTHKVIPWENVTENDGTSLVHIAPGCGPEDHELGKKLGLPTEICPIDESGHYVTGFGHLTGKNVSQAYDIVSEDLIKKNYLFKVKDHTHRYPVCWRCKEELAFRLVSEWFIKTEEIRPRLKQAAEKVVWYPEHIGKLMQDWLDNMGDWVISRKRFWGLPLPIWKCDKCDEFTFIESKKELQEKAISGMDQLQELHRPWIDNVKLKCEKCQAQMTRITDVGDCWLDAGIVPYSTLNYLNDKEYWKKWFPSDLIIEMREQVRLWFYSLLFMSVTLEGEIPYKSVLGYEKVHDEHGKPMHKSSGNAIWFDDGVEKMGADVMRWMYVTQNPKENLHFGYTPAKETRNKLNVIYNMAKYISSYCNKEEIKLHDIKNPINRWILSRLNTLIAQTTQLIEDLKIYKATQLIEEFFIEDLSRTYLHFTRNLIKNKDKETMQTTKMVFRDFLNLISPMTPFLAEDIYQTYFKEDEESIHLKDWPIPTENNKQLETTFQHTKEIIAGILAAREKTEYGIRWPLKTAIIKTKEQEIKDAIKQFRNLILEQTNIKEIIAQDEDPEGTKVNIKPNFRNLGETFAAETGEVVTGLKQKDDYEIYMELRKSKKYILKVNDKEFEILKEHLIIEKLPPKNYAYAKLKYAECFLFTQIDKQLEKEGFQREIIRHIQQLRKENNLENKDRIELFVESSEKITAIIKEYEAKIKSITGTKEIHYAVENKEKAKQVKVKEEEITIQLKITV